MSTPTIALWVLCVPCQVAPTHGQEFSLPVLLADGAQAQLHVRFLAADLETRPPIVLIHFTSSHSGQMLEAGRMLARRGYPVYAYDLLGHGLSSPARGNVEDELVALRQLVGLIHARHGGRPIALAGSSLGGDIALLFTLWEAYLERKHGAAPMVGAVIGQGVVTPWQRDVARHFSLGMRIINDTDPLPLQWVLPPVLPTSWLFQVPDLYDSPERRKAFRSDPLRRRSYPASMVVRVTRYLPHRWLIPARTPTLLLNGTGDRLVVPRYEQRVYQGMLRFLPNTELQLVSGATHGMFQEDAEITIHLIDEWLRRTLVL